MPKAKFKTDQEWLDVIQTCRTSGMTDKDWCHSNGISQTSLYRHINRLRKKDYAIPGHGRVQLDKGHEVVPIEFDKITELDQKYVSLVESAKRNNLNVLLYLTQVLSMMRGYKDEPELVEDMMPWSDLMQQSCGVNNA